MAEQGFATIPRSMLHDADVPRDAKLVYLMLSSHVGGNQSAWPSHKRIADLLGMSLSTVKRQLHWLRDKGFITWQARIGDNEARITNEYTLLAGSSSASIDGGGPTVKRAGSHRTRGPRKPDPGSVGTDPRSDGTTPQVSESEPLGLCDLTEEESLNESQGTNKTSPQKSAELVSIRQDVERICTHLADRIEANGSKRPTIGPNWRTEARLMLDADRRDEGEVHRAIDWCQNHHFWRSNVLSVSKLREKFDQMRLQAEADRAPKSRQQQATDQLFLEAAQRMGVTS